MDGRTPFKTLFKNKVCFYYFFAPVTTQLQCRTKEAIIVCHLSLTCNRESVFFQVFSNMNAAYKQEKKSAKRRGRDVSSITLTVTEPLCPSDDSPSPKRLKDDLFLTFPVETVISAVQVVAEEGKDALEYVLPGPDVH